MLDAGGALERSIARLTERFAALPAAAVAEAVYRAHHELQTTSTIQDHLVPLAQRRAGDELARRAASTDPTTPDASGVGGVGRVGKTAPAGG